MPEVYEKISDVEYKKIETVTTVKEIVYNYEDLLKREEQLVKDIQYLQDNLDLIRSDIQKANDLGIN